jgi:hypothetical protein
MWALAPFDRRNDGGDLFAFLDVPRRLLNISGEILAMLKFEPESLREVLRESLERLGSIGTFDFYDLDEAGGPSDDKPEVICSNTKIQNIWLEDSQEGFELTVEDFLRWASLLNGARSSTLTSVTQTVWPRALKTSITAPCGRPSAPGTSSTSAATSPAFNPFSGTSRRNATCSYNFKLIFNSRDLEQA